MNTIMIMAEALAKASKLDIIRLDMNYNNISDLYRGRVTLGNQDTIETRFVFDICEDGTVEKVD